MEILRLVTTFVVHIWAGSTVACVVLGSIWIALVYFRLI